MRSIWICALMSLMGAAYPVVADDERTVTVDGEGTVSAIPDSARINMAVQVRDRDMQIARQAVIKVTRDFLAFADRSAIDAQKVQTSGVTVRPEYRWNPDDNRQVLLGYLVRRDITVDLEDLDKLGDLIEGAVDIGVNQVSPPQLKNSRERELRRDALAAAAEDARANAHRLAATLGMALGAAREISTIQTPVPQPIYRERAMVSAASDGGGDTYYTGELRFEARVTARFDLIDDAQ